MKKKSSKTTIAKYWLSSAVSRLSNHSSTYIRDRIQASENRITSGNMIIKDYPDKLFDPKDVKEYIERCKNELSKRGET